jgi:hypothetical protein
MNYSKLLTPNDYDYLSAQFDLPVDAIARMTDDDWCAYIGCEKSDLAFYLLDDENYVEPEMMSLDELDGEDDLDDEAIIWRDLFENDDFAEVVPITRTKPAKKPYSPMPRPYQTTGYGSPSPMAVKTKPVVVPHHYEVVR